MIGPMKRFALGLKPDDKLFLKENEKRELNCFKREDFHLRDFVYEPLNLKIY